MKLFMVFILVIASCGGSVVAGTVSRFSTAVSVSLSEGCTTVECTESFKAKASTSLEASITPAEAAAFQPDSLISFDTQIIGDIQFRLSDDPNYQPGDTSAQFTKSTMDLSSPVNHLVQLSWGAGKVKIIHKISGKGTTSQMHPAAREAFSPTEKSHSDFDPVSEISLTVANGGTTVYSAEAAAILDISYFVTTTRKANGSAQETASIKIKSQSFVPR